MKGKIKKHIKDYLIRTLERDPNANETIEAELNAQVRVLILEDLIEDLEKRVNDLEKMV